MTTGEIIGLCAAGAVMLGLFILGIVLLSGRGAFLVAGYNTMSAKEKSRWNAKALCRAVGALLLVVATGCTAGLVLMVLGNTALGAPFIYVPILLTIPFIIWVNISRRFKAGGGK